MNTKIKKPEPSDETISIRLPKALLKTLDAEAKKLKVSRGYLIREILKGYLNGET